MSAADDASAADAAWAAQLGPALTEADAAQLLGRTQEAVARSPELLRLQQRGTGELVYPLFQFTSEGQIAGVAPLYDLRVITPAF